MVLLGVKVPFSANCCQTWSFGTHLCPRHLGNGESWWCCRPKNTYGLLPLTTEATYFFAHLCPMFSDYNHSCKAEANRSKTRIGKQYLATLSVEQIRSNAIIWLTSVSQRSDLSESKDWWQTLLVVEPLGNKSKWYPQDTHVGPTSPFRQKKK